MTKRKITLLCLCLALVALVGAIVAISITSSNDEYTVKFVYADGTLIKSVKVNKGEDATAPTVPNRNGEAFVYWASSFKNVQKNLTVKAVCYKMTDAGWQTYTDTYDRDSTGLTGASIRLSSMDESIDRTVIVFPNVNTEGDEIKSLRSNCLNSSGVSSEVKTVIIPHGVVKLQENAFANCTSLETVILPDSVKEIDSNAFSNCINLKNVELPTSLKYVYGSSFKGAINLELTVREGASLKIVDGNIYSSDGRTFVAYADYKKPNVEISGRTSYIGKKAFYATDITSVKLSSNIIEIGEEAFRDCTRLQSVSGADSLETISDKAFRGCNSLSEFDFAASIRKIGAEAFYNTALSRVFLPSGLINIGSKAFKNVGQDDAIPEVTTIYSPNNEDYYNLATSDWACDSPVYFGYDGEGETVEFTVTFVYINENGDEVVLAKHQIEFGKYCPYPYVDKVNGTIIRRWNASAKKGTYVDPMSYLTRVTENITIYAEL